MSNEDPPPVDTSIYNGWTKDGPTESDAPGETALGKQYSSDAAGDGPTKSEVSAPDDGDTTTPGPLRGVRVMLETASRANSHWAGGLPSASTS